MLVKRPFEDKGQFYYTDVGAKYDSYSFRPIGVSWYYHSNGLSWIQVGFMDPISANIHVVTTAEITE